MLHKMDVVFLELFCVFAGLSGYILVRINEVENGPYMDEVFHIPQVQNYCVGKFNEWDPMITTLPGLYLTTVGIIKPISALFNIPVSVLCSTLWLRSINVVFAIGNMYLLYSLTWKLHKGEKMSSPGKEAVTAFILSIFPVLYFFTFLYYTDSGSTFCVLLMYLLCLDGSHKMAAVIGAVSVMFRQTNIVWVVFMAGITASDCLMHRIHPEKKDISKESQRNLGFLLAVVRQLYNWIMKDRKSLVNWLSEMICKIWLYLLVIVGFVAFVVINGSIVVGAKDHHQAVLHFPQLFYLASFMAGFSFMHHISVSRVKSFFRFIHRKPLTVVVYCLLSTLLVWKFTYVHPYLLADNRHYTFYVWSRIYQHYPFIRYALIPCYGFAIWTLFKALEKQHILWKCVYCICLSVNLIPSPLLEFRYFIIPYLIYRLNMPLASYIKLSVELTLYVVINFVTLYLFLKKPFLWEGISGYQRFMW